MNLNSLGTMDIVLLTRLQTWDNHGRHFTETYPVEWLIRMESDGFIKIERSTDETLIDKYSLEYLSVELTEIGLLLTEIY